MDMRKWDLFKTATKNIAGNVASISSVRSFWCGLVIVENRLYEAEGKSF